MTTENMTKQEIAREFEIEVKELDRKEILLAFYEFQDYEGSAFILYKEDGKLYEVNGSHCSCYGLEGQWDPEETSIEFLKTRNFSYDSYAKEIKEFLDTQLNEPLQ